MMRRGLLALAVLASMAGGGVAQDAAKPPPFKASDYPIEVRKALRLRAGGMQAAGRRQGDVRARHRAQGRPQRRRPRRLYRQLSGHRMRDLCWRSFAAPAAARMDFLVTLPNGTIRSVFADRVRGYEILPGRAAHGPLPAARLVLRRLGQSVVLQGAAHHRQAVRVQGAEGVMMRLFAVLLRRRHARR